VTINLHKLCHRITFKKKAKRAISEIKKFAGAMMDTSADVRVETKLNKFVWSKGIRNIPKRVRVRLSRKRNEDEEAEHPVSHPPVRRCPLARPPARLPASQPPRGGRSSVHAPGPHLRSTRALWCSGWC